METFKMQLKIWCNSLLLCSDDVWRMPLTGLLGFMQGVWPFSRLTFTEAARTRKRILEQLADTREAFYSDPEVQSQIHDGVNHV